MNARMQHPESLAASEKMQAVADQAAAAAGAERAPGPAPAADEAEGPDDAVPSFGADAAEGVQGLSYEQARGELVAVVQRLESGDLPLEEALTLWKRGEALADHCQSWLDGARKALDAARASAGDEPAEAPPA